MSKLQEARLVREKRRQEDALLEELPQLEKQAQEADLRLKFEEDEKWAKRVFEEAVTDWRSRDISHRRQYDELLNAFRSFALLMRSDSRDRDSIWQKAKAYAYYLSFRDSNLGHTFDSQVSHAEQLLLDNQIQTAKLPEPRDTLDKLLINAVLQAINISKR